MDTVVTGGGGAPIYQYVGEPDLRTYVAAANARVRVDHLVKPGTAPEENPHHFVVVQVDGDRLSLEGDRDWANRVHAVQGQREDCAQRWRELRV